MMPPGCMHLYFKCVIGSTLCTQQILLYYYLNVFNHTPTTIFLLIARYWRPGVGVLKYGHMHIHITCVRCGLAGRPLYSSSTPFRCAAVLLASLSNYTI